jgi:hypothetical protein
MPLRRYGKWKTENEQGGLMATIIPRSPAWGEELISFALPLIR